jgi:hypothetical protein
MTKDDNKEDYHGIAPVKHVIKKIKRDYDKDPKDWHLIGSSDDQGNYDTFITKKPNAYWLKSKQLSPYSALTMGTTVRKIDQDIDEKIGKSMSQEDFLRLFGMVVPIKKDQNIVATGIEKYSQKHGDHLKKIISEKNANIGYQMARKLDKEFTRLHPQRKNLYI